MLRNGLICSCLVASRRHRLTATAASRSAVDYPSSDSTCEGFWLAIVSTEIPAWEMI